MNDAMNEARMEQAAMWWAKFQECEPAAEDVAAWAAWMEADEDNALAFKSMNELALRIRRTREVAPDRLRTLRSATSLRSTLPRRFAVAASVLVVVAAATAIALRLGVDTSDGSRTVTSTAYMTQVAAQREVLLPDGSRVVLGGASAIATEFSAEQRLVHLTAGEAFFEVKHEGAGRPFVVDAGVATVRAVGTAFNVRRNDHRVAVTVTEGRVKVDRPGGMLTRLVVATGLQERQVVDVSRDQQVIIDAADTPLAVAAADARRATSWRRGRLEFVDEPLDSVIDDVSRYSPTPLIADDPRLSAITYTGSFTPERFESWLGALENVFPVEVSREANAIVVRARQDTQ